MTHIGGGNQSILTTKSDTQVRRVEEDIMLKREVEDIFFLKTNQ